MEIIYDLLRFFHVISFVFMCVLLFNLIVSNERVLLGLSFNYEADQHLESIIKNGFNWCYIFQISIFITGLLLLITGHLGIAGLWQDWIVLTKTIILISFSLVFLVLWLLPDIYWWENWLFGIMFVVCLVMGLSQLLARKNGDKSKEKSK